MFVVITLELEDGRHARLRFVETPYYRATGRCEDSGHCEHDVSPAYCEPIFNAMAVPHDGDALESVRTVLTQRKAEVFVPRDPHITKVS
jgi:hypothetical protein